MERIIKQQGLDLIEKINMELQSKEKEVFYIISVPAFFLEKHFWHRFNHWLQKQIKKSLPDSYPEMESMERLSTRIKAKYYKYGQSYTLSESFPGYDPKNAKYEHFCYIQTNDFSLIERYYHPQNGIFADKIRSSLQKIWYIPYEYKEVTEFFRKNYEKEAIFERLANSFGEMIDNLHYYYHIYPMFDKKFITEYMVSNSYKEENDIDGLFYEYDKKIKELFATKEKDIKALEGYISECIMVATETSSVFLPLIIVYNARLNALQKTTREKLFSIYKLALEVSKEAILGLIFVPNHILLSLKISILVEAWMGIMEDMTPEVREEEYSFLMEVFKQIEKHLMNQQDIGEKLKDRVQEVIEPKFDEICDNPYRNIFFGFANFPGHSIKESVNQYSKSLFLKAMILKKYGDKSEVGGILSKALKYCQDDALRAMITEEIIDKKSES
jgi:hypothetical protein